MAEAGDETAPDPSNRGSGPAAERQQSTLAASLADRPYAANKALLLAHGLPDNGRSNGAQR